MELRTYYDNCASECNQQKEARQIDVTHVTQYNERLLEPNWSSSPWKFPEEETMEIDFGH